MLKKALILTTSFISLASPAYGEAVMSCYVAGDDTYIPVEQNYPLDDPEPAHIDGETPGSEVNVRSGPGIDYEVTAYGLVGDAVQVIGQAFSTDCETWIQVRFPVSEHIGWIHANYIQLHYGRGWWD